MKKYLLHTVYGLLILLIVSAFAFKILQPIQVLPRITLAPAFTFTDQDGERLTSEDMRGRIVLYTFTYTNCKEPCFNIDKTMQEVQSRLNEVNLNKFKITFVTVSFDPERDSHNTLKTYAESIGADTTQWKFATTTDQTLLKTIIGAGFETYYEQKPDGSFSFDPAFVLVDGWGVVRGEYRYQTEVSTTDRILRHLNVLADELQNSKGSAKLAYEAAHLFLCYAP